VMYLGLFRLKRVSHLMNRYKLSRIVTVLILLNIGMA
jgi:hypothetical protein